MSPRTPWLWSKIQPRSVYRYYIEGRFGQLYALDWVCFISLLLVSLLSLTQFWEFACRRLHLFERIDNLRRKWDCELNVLQWIPLRELAHHRSRLHQYFQTRWATGLAQVYAFSLWDPKQGVLHYFRVCIIHFPLFYSICSILLAFFPKSVKNNHQPSFFICDKFNLPFLIYILPRTSNFLFFFNN